MKLKTITLNYILEINLFVLAVLVLVILPTYWWVSIILGVLIAFGVMLKGFWVLLSAEITDKKLNKITRGVFKSKKKLNEIHDDVEITKENTGELLRLFKEKLIPDNKIIQAFKQIIDESKRLSKQGKPNRALENLSQLEGFAPLLKGDSDILLEFKIAKSKAYQEAELIDEAIKINKEIVKEFNKDIRAFLYLSDIYSSVGDYKLQEKYFKEAQNIDRNHPSLKSIQIAKRLKLGEKVELSDDDIWGEDNSWERSFCYYLHSVLKEQNNQVESRNSFIEKAIEMEPQHILYRTSYLDYKVSDIESEKQEGDVKDLNIRVQNLVEEIEKLEFICKEDDTPKRKLRVHFTKMKISFLDISTIDERKAENNYNELIHAILASYFDDYTDITLAMTLGSAHPLSSESITNKILEYIEKSKKKPSDDLIFLVVMDALKLFKSYGTIKTFCKKYGGDKYLGLIEVVEINNKEAIIEELENNYDDKRRLKYIINERDDEFKLVLIDKFVNAAEEGTKNILEILKLAILHDRKDFHSAIQIIQSIDINKASPILARMAFDIAHDLNFYETEKNALRRLIDLNSYPGEQFVFKANLAICDFNLKEYRDALKNGLEVLENVGKITLKGQQFILFVCLSVLNMDGKYPEALELLNKYNTIPKDFRLYIISSEIYLNNKKYKESLDSIITGIKNVDHLKDEHFSVAHYNLIMLENVSNIKFPQLKEIRGDVFVKLDGIDEWFYVGYDNPLDAIPIINTHDKRYKLLFGKKINDTIEWPGDEGKIDKIKRRIAEIRNTADYIGLRGFQTMTKDAIAGSPYIKMIEVGSEPETIKKSLMTFMSRDDENFELYKSNKIPLSFFITLLGSVQNAFSKIRFSKECFVNINSSEDLNEQNKVAVMAIEGSPMYIDGTSLFILFESGIYKKVLSVLPNYFVPASAIEEYRNLIQKFTAIPKKGSMQIGKEGNDLRGTIFSQEEADKIKNHVIDFFDFIQGDSDKVFGMSNNEKKQDFIEKNILSSVSDACIKAQRDENGLLLTEDPTYPIYYQQLTKGKKQKYFSVWTLIRNLYDKGKITWDEYLDTFYWLTIYREKFLQTNSQDIFNSIFGDSKKTSIITPQNIDKLNLLLVWSEEYGADINSIINVASDVLIRLIITNLIADEQLEDVYKKIFVPVIENRDKNFWKEKLIASVESKLTYVKSKLALLSAVTPNTDKRLQLLNDSINKYVSDGNKK